MIKRGTMELFKHFKNAIFSVVPFYIVLLLLNVIFGETNFRECLTLTLATIIMVIGMAIFFPGLKAGLEDPLPSLMENLITKHSKAFLFLYVFVLGFVITFSEPSVRVFARQFVETVSSSSETVLLIIVSLSCSLFLLSGVVRLFLKLPMRLTILLMYVLFFIISAFLSEASLGVALDSSAAATGLITVPLITVLGSSFSDQLEGVKTEDKFGFSGIASIGVLLAVSIYLLFTPLSSSVSASSVTSASRAREYLSSMFSVLKAILPFMILYIITEVCMLSHRGYMLRSRMFGFLFVLVGVALIFSSATVVFVPFVESVAKSLYNKGPVLTVAVGVIFGFLSAFLEPSVTVLAKGIEKELNGRISYILIVLAIGLGLALTMGVFITKMYVQFSTRWFFLAMYALILILMFFTDKLFVGIAFDAGSAGAGVMSGVVLLPFVLTIADLSPNATSLSGFGVVGGVVTFPILICEVLGIIYSYKVKGRVAKEKSNG